MKDFVKMLHSASQLTCLIVCPGLKLVGGSFGSVLVVSEAEIIWSLNLTLQGPTNNHTITNAGEASKSSNSFTNTAFLSSKACMRHFCKSDRLTA